MPADRVDGVAWREVVEVSGGVSAVRRDQVAEEVPLAIHRNGEPLAVKHGAPARLRVERQLGYKHAKYVMRIEAAADLAGIGGGKGGFWEDRGYEWYAGI